MSLDLETEAFNGQRESILENHNRVPAVDHELPLVSLSHRVGIY